MKRFSIAGRRIVCLDLPDDYALTDPAVAMRRWARMARHLPTISDETT